MRIIAFDPGAERMGFAALETDGTDDVKSKPLTVLGSGHFGLKREKTDSGKREPYEPYRLKLISLWVDEGQRLLRSYKPTILVNEILPVVGFNNAVQSRLAATAITTVQVVAFQTGIEVVQIAATTVKKAIGGNGKATKVQVRNGVYELIPDTKRFHQEWTKVFDHSDAFAVGLTYLGYANGKR